MGARSVAPRPSSVGLLVSRNPHSPWVQFSTRPVFRTPPDEGPGMGVPGQLTGGGRSLRARTWAGVAKPNWVRMRRWLVVRRVAYTTRPTGV